MTKFEIICCDCGDDPDRDYREVPPELQRVRGPYPIAADITAYVKHAAQPVVRVLIPPTPARSYPADLLLCGHHYRAALAAADAVAIDEAGSALESASALSPQVVPATAAPAGSGAGSDI